MDAHERFWAKVREIEGRFDAKTREIDVAALTGRSDYRIPKPLKGCVTLEKLWELCPVGSGRLNLGSGSGWLFGQKQIETYVATLPDELQLGRRQLYSTLYRQDWLLWIGDLAITHVNSASNYLVEHHAHAAEAHRQAGRPSETSTADDVASGPRLFPPVPF